MDGQTLDEQFAELASAHSQALLMLSQEMMRSAQSFAEAARGLNEQIHDIMNTEVSAQVLRSMADHRNA